MKIWKSRTEGRVRNYTSLFPSYLRNKTTKMTLTMIDAVACLFPVSLMVWLGYFWRINSSNFLQLIERVILLSTAFTSIHRGDYMYILLKSFRETKMCFWYNVWSPNFFSSSWCWDAYLHPEFQRMILLLVASFFPLQKCDNIMIKFVANILNSWLYQVVCRKAENVGGRDPAL